jgi:hypothetical protein
MKFLEKLVKVKVTLRLSQPVSIQFLVATRNVVIDLLPSNGKNIHRPKTNKQTPWSESASELYRPSDRRLSAKSLPTFADGGCHMVSATYPYGRILGFLDRSRYFSLK